MNAESSVWGFVQNLGPWFWHAKSLAAFTALIWLVRMAPPETQCRAVARVFMLFGLFMIALSSTLNSGLGPIGDIVFFISFSAGSWFRARQHVRAGIARPMTGVEIERNWQRERAHLRH